MLKATKTAWCGTGAAAVLFVWAAIGLAQQSDAAMRRCLAAGAPLAECQLRIHGR